MNCCCWQSLWTSVLNNYFVHLRCVKCYDQCVLSLCLNVSVSACEHIWKTRHANMKKFLKLVACCCGSVFLWWHCDMLCISCFENDIMFSHNQLCKRGANRMCVIYWYSKWPASWTAPRQSLLSTVGLFGVKQLWYYTGCLYISYCSSSCSALTLLLWVR